MNAGLGAWLFGMSLGAGALGGMFGIAGGMFVVLAATTFVARLLYAVSGFGFAVVAAPLFLLFLDPGRAGGADGWQGGCRGVVLRRRCFECRGVPRKPQHRGDL